MDRIWVLIIGLFVLGGCTTISSTHQTDDEQYVSLSLMDMKAELFSGGKTDTQKDAFWERYKGEKVQWHGYVKNVDDNLLGQRVVLVRAFPKQSMTDIRSDAAVIFESSEDNKLQSYGINDVIHFEGTLRKYGDLLETIYIEDAIVIEQPSPTNRNVQQRSQEKTVPVENIKTIEDTPEEEAEAATPNKKTAQLTESPEIDGYELLHSCTFEDTTECDGLSPVIEEGISYVEGLQGQAVYIREGTRLSYPTEKLLDMRKGAIEMSVRPSWSPSTPEEHYFIDIFDSSRWSIRHTSRTENLRFEVGTPPTYDIVEHDISDWEEDEWHTIRIQWDTNTGMKAYIDGDLVGTNSGNFPIEPDTISDFVDIGYYRPATKGEAHAAIDNLRVYR